MEGIGWWDVAREFIPLGATLSFAYDVGGELDFEGEEPPKVARLTQPAADGATAEYATIPRGDEAADVAAFLEGIADHLGDVASWDDDGEFGEAERAVYRDWHLIAKTLLGRD